MTRQHIPGPARSGLEHSRTNAVRRSCGAARYWCAPFERGDLVLQLIEQVACDRVVRSVREMDHGKD